MFLSHVELVTLVYISLHFLLPSLLPPPFLPSLPSPLFLPLSSSSTLLFFPPHSDGGKFKRIPVFKGPGGGFGFAPPYEFDSLLSLVLYYATNTMEKHNQELETMLKFPAFYKQ